MGGSAYTWMYTSIAPQPKKHKAFSQIFVIFFKKAPQAAKNTAGWGNSPSCGVLYGTPGQILTGGLPLRRRSLYTTELRGRMTRNILPFWRWICQCLICWERGGEKRLYSPPPSVIMGRKSGSDRRRRTGPVRNIEKRTVNLWTERRSSRAARCPRSSPGI